MLIFRTITVKSLDCINNTFIEFNISFYDQKADLILFEVMSAKGYLYFQFLNATCNMKTRTKASNIAYATRLSDERDT